MTDFSNVLIIKLKHLGDVLTTTPLVGGIKQAWPEAKVGYLINPGGEDLVRFHPDVARVWTVPREGGLGRQIRFIRSLRGQRFDLVIELSGGDRGAFLTRLTGAPYRVGYRARGYKARFGRERAFTHHIDALTTERHQVDSHLDALRVLGIEPGFQTLTLHWPPEAQAEVDKKLAAGGIEPGAPYTVVHTPSRWMFKAWTPEGNAAVIDYLAEKVGRVVVTSSPEPKEMAYVRQVLSRVRTRPLDLAGRMNLREMAAVIAGARLFFGVDSLPMHMAAAVNTTAVALFGPSAEKNWAPWGRGHFVVAKDWDCRPCRRDGCDGSKISRCLVELTVDEVIPFIDRALEPGP